MDKTQEKIFDLLENYFEYCKTNDFTDFEIWCEDKYCVNTKVLLSNIFCKISVASSSVNK